MANEPFDPFIPKSFMTGIKDAFSIQAQTPIEITHVAAMSPEKQLGIAITSAIGLKSSSYVGTLALCFPKATFLGVVNKMLGEKFTDITKENSDAAGELLNIVYGTTRVKLNQGGYDFLPAIPTIAEGSDIGISHGSAAKMVKIECSSEVGRFHLEISLRKIGK